VKKPRLVISDVDGTLIDKTESLSPELRELSQVIRTNHIAFTLASGRSPQMVRDFIQLLDIQLPVVVNNGAAAVTQTETIWSDYIDPMCLKDAVLKANSMDMMIVMGDGKNELVYRYNEYVQRQMDQFGRYNHFYIPLENEWPSLKIQKVLIIDPQKPGRIDSVIEMLSPYRDQINAVRYDARSLDIMPRTASKGAALRRLAEHLQIDLCDVMAIGDAQNDIEMIHDAGIGVAVSNAAPELKNCADYVCTHKNVEGVLEAVRRFCLQES